MTRPASLSDATVTSEYDRRSGERRPDGRSFCAFLCESNYMDSVKQRQRPRPNPCVIVTCGVLALRSEGDESAFNEDISRVPLKQEMHV